MSEHDVSPAQRARQQHRDRGGRYSETVRGEGAVDPAGDPLDLSDGDAIRSRIEAAGVQYPINWDEMGSSEKDLWEERMLRAIRRSEARAARIRERQQQKGQQS